MVLPPKGGSHQTGVWELATTARIVCVASAFRRKTLQICPHPLDCADRDRDLAAVWTPAEGPPEDGRDRLHGRARSEWRRTVRSAGRGRNARQPAASRECARDRRGGHRRRRGPPVLV